MKIEQNFIADIKNIMQAARNRAYTAINFYMVETYWKMGERIVIEEQKGSNRAEYGAFLIRQLSKRLTEELGKGFDISNLKNFRQFYLSFGGNQKSDAVRSFSETACGFQLRNELTWTHYRMIMHVENPEARKYYMNEAADNNWSTRVLQRNINTLYFERILSTSNKQEACIQAGFFETQSPADFIKDPYILEFLKIPQHQDIGQMDMYVRMYDDLKRSKTDNPTIGLILCTSKDATIVKYSVLKDNEQLFATKYRSCLPSEQELIAEIERNRHILEERNKTIELQ